MKRKTLLAVLPVFLLAAGCTSTYEPPAPAATKVPPKKSVAKKPGPQYPQAAQPAPQKVTPGPTTYPIDNSSGNFRDEGQLPNFRAEPITPPAQSPQTLQAPGAVPAPNVLPPQSANLATPAPPPEAVFSSIKLEDAAIPAGTSPAVLALVTESDRDRNKGDLNASVVVMERALRLDPRNPTLTYKLAQLKLKQAKPQPAEELAGKAALLAGRDLDLKRKSWLLIAEARHLQHDNKGAKEAKIKAESFFGH